MVILTTIGAKKARHLIDSIRAEYAGTPITELATPRTYVGAKVGLS